MWSYLEDAFTGGDLVQQLPHEAKRFSMIDKKWVKIMHKAFDAQKVVNVCVGEDSPRDMLVHLKEQLEICQRSLAGTSWTLLCLTLQVIWKRSEQSSRECILWRIALSLTYYRKSQICLPLLLIFGLCSTMCIPWCLTAMTRHV